MGWELRHGAIGFGFEAMDKGSGTVDEGLGTQPGSRL